MALRSKCTRYGVCTYRDLHAMAMADSSRTEHCSRQSSSAQNVRCFTQAVNRPPSTARTPRPHCQTAADC
eukprot:scaffold20339_cov120-Isochrysis_galbana.AAC.9